jgi:hypothetical protein
MMHLINVKVLRRLVNEIDTISSTLTASMG